MAPTFSLYHKDTNGASWVVCEDTNPAVVRDALYDTKCKNVVEYPGFAGFDIKISSDNSTTAICMDFQTLGDAQDYMNDVVDQMRQKSSGAQGQPTSVKNEEEYTIDAYTSYKGIEIKTPFISTPITAAALAKLNMFDCVELIKPHIKNVNKEKKSHLHLYNMLESCKSFKDNAEFVDYILSNINRDDLYVDENSHYSRLCAKRVRDNQLMFDTPFENFLSNVKRLD